jgi:type I restriction enzyme S subunit
MGLTLNDVCLAIVDCEHKTAPTQAVGHPSIRTPNIGRGRLILGGVNRVSDETYAQWTQRMEPMAGDLILAREAPIGNVAIVPVGLKVCLGQRTVLIRADRSKVLPEYLVYLMLGDEIQGRIQSQSNGATVHHLNMKDIRGLALPKLPTLTEQRRIASILSAYDDLMENNTRRIAILEEMARRIYEEWFVRFRFPGHEGVRMVESELGLVPEGWSVTSLGAIADVQWGDTTVTKKSYVAQGYTAYSAAGPDGLLPYADYNRTGVVLAAIGSVGTTWFASGAWSCIKNTIRFFSTDEARACDEFLFLATHLKSFWPLRGAAQPFISLGDARAQKLAVPGPETMLAFRRVVGTQLRLCATLRLANDNLSTTRDLLLPKLISGELDVSSMPEPEALSA